ncbi:MAG: class I SAM-dependent methyltransferase [Spirochaetota bacterium]
MIKYFYSIISMVKSILLKIKQILRGEQFILDQYVKVIPSPQCAVDIFKDEWISKLPEEYGIKTGSAELFTDERINWLIKEIGGVKGKTILELGPLEAAHTYMLHKAGVSEIKAIESNTRAFMKCLIMKEILNLHNVKMLCGDFRQFLLDTNEKYDICVASGVLYHMINPVELIESISKVANTVFLWTQYYNKDIINNKPSIAHKFGRPIVSEHAGFKHTLNRYKYKTALGGMSFCGGTEKYSNWLTKEDLLLCLKHFNFSNIKINFHELNHINGPAIAIIAQK